MPGFLLDNNHVQALFHKKGDVVSKVQAHRNAGVPILASAITIGEIEAGHRMNTPTTEHGQARRDEFIAWLNRDFLPNALPVTIKTRGFYADLIGRIWKNHPPASAKNKTEVHLAAQGLDINDVWSVACAWEHGLTFVTQDGMPWIREAAGKDVQWDCWY